MVYLILFLNEWIYICKITYTFFDKQKNYQVKWYVKVFKMCWWYSDIKGWELLIYNINYDKSMISIIKKEIHIFSFPDTYFCCQMIFDKIFVRGIKKKKILNKTKIFKQSNSSIFSRKELIHFDTLSIQIRAFSVRLSDICKYLSWFVMRIYS